MNKHIAFSFFVSSLFFLHLSRSEAMELNHICNYSEPGHVISTLTDCGDGRFYVTVKNRATLRLDISNPIEPVSKEHRHEEVWGYNNFDLIETYVADDPESDSYFVGYNDQEITYTLLGDIDDWLGTLYPGIYSRFYVGDVSHMEVLDNYLIASNKASNESQKSSLFYDMANRREVISLNHESGYPDFEVSEHILYMTNGNCESNQPDLVVYDLVSRDTLFTIIYPQDNFLGIAIINDTAVIFSGENANTITNYKIYNISVPDNPLFSQEIDLPVPFSGQHFETKSNGSRVYLYSDANEAVLNLEDLSNPFFEYHNVLTHHVRSVSFTDNGIFKVGKEMNGYEYYDVLNTGDTGFQEVPVESNILPNKLLFNDKHAFYSLNDTIYSINHENPESLYCQTRSLFQEDYLYAVNDDIIVLRENVSGSENINLISYRIDKHGQMGEQLSSRLDQSGIQWRYYCQVLTDNNLLARFGGYYDLPGQQSFSIRSMENMDVRIGLDDIRCFAVNQDEIVTIQKNSSGLLTFYQTEYTGQEIILTETNSWTLPETVEIDRYDENASMAYSDGYIYVFLYRSEGYYPNEQEYIDTYLFKAETGDLLFSRTLDTYFTSGGVLPFKDNLFCLTGSSEADTPQMSIFSYDKYSELGYRNTVKDLDDFTNWSIEGNKLFSYGYHGISIYDYVEDLPSVTSKEFEILSMYPNPFNQIINIDFVSYRVTAVHWSIYNILGQRVYHSPETFYEEGFNRIAELDLSSMSNGIYFLSVYKGNEVLDVKKMIKIRQ